MTMYWLFIMRIKPTSAHEDMWIYYAIDVVSLLHVLATYCGYLQQYVRMVDATTSHYMDGDVIYTALEHPSLMAFSTNIFICILYRIFYIVTYFQPYSSNFILYVCQLVVLFCVIHPSKNTSMNMATIGGRNM